MGCIVVFLIFIAMAAIGAIANGEYSAGFGILAVEVLVIVGFLLWLAHGKRIAKREKQEEERVRQRRAEKKRERDAVKAIRKKENRKKWQQAQKQKQARKSIVDSISHAKECYQRINYHYGEAGKYLVKAETAFKNRAYSPFWDAIENAALELGHFSENVRRLSTKVQQYKKGEKQYEGYNQYSFPLKDAQITHVRGICKNSKFQNKMRNILEKAQQDYEFSSIFEQRKTQKLIVAGFKNLEDVLTIVGNKTTSALETLNNTVQASNIEITSAIDDLGGVIMDVEAERAERDERTIEQGRVQHDEATAQRAKQHDEIMESDAQRIEREEQALEMLEDISENTSRRRK